jgi:hypothetical protein
MFYKILPDVKISWSDVWVGALITSLLFVVGKYALGLYCVLPFSERGISPSSDGGSDRKHPRVKPRFSAGRLVKRKRLDASTRISIRLIILNRREVP